MTIRFVPAPALALLCLLGAAIWTTRTSGQTAAPAPNQSRTGSSTLGVASQATVELGRLLFWDPILSGEKDIACATCHHPAFAYADGRDISLGTGSVGLGPTRRDASSGRIPLVKRNSPTVLNTAFNGLRGGRGRRQAFDTATPPSPASVDQAAAPMLWDNRVRSLEAQALEPLKAREEMRGDAYGEDVAVDRVVSRLQANAQYVALFAQAFGPGAPIDAQQLGQAVAAFERSLVGMNSPFDRFTAGDQRAITTQQRRGLDAFNDAGCARCHGGPMFSDFGLHAEGVAEHPKLAQPDAGTRQFRFRTPTLRNVATTAPYMHNGMLATLDDVLRFYDNGRSENPNVLAATTGQRGGNGGGRAAGNGGAGGRRGDGDGVPRLDRRFVGVNDISDDQMRDIVAFLAALSDTSFDTMIPAQVPSGLPPGGSIRAAAVR